MVTDRQIRVLRSKRMQGQTLEAAGRGRWHERALGEHLARRPDVVRDDHEPDLKDSPGSVGDRDRA